MQSIKSYTDIEQSKKLAKILPLESADMWYQYTGISIKDGSQKPIYFPMVIRDCESDEDIPCWSLTALLDVLPLPNLVQDKLDNELFWQCSSYDEDGTLLCEIYDNNPVDACVAMIEKIHELNLL